MNLFRGEKMECKKYGVWNRMTKRFVFGISEPSKKKAFERFRDLAYKASFKCRYEIKEIPIGFKNPKNHFYKKGLR